MIEPVDSAEFLVMSPLEETIKTFTKEFLQSFPRAELLLGSDVDGEADIEIDIYVPDEEIESAGLKADELALTYDLKTGFFIIPVVLSLDSCPVK